MKINFKCWGSPIYYRARYKGLPDWHSRVAYGLISWPSRCEWIVPGTHGYLE